MRRLWINNPWMAGQAGASASRDGGSDTPLAPEGRQPRKRQAGQEDEPAGPGQEGPVPVCGQDATRVDASG